MSNSRFATIVSLKLLISAKVLLAGVFVASAVALAQQAAAQARETNPSAQESKAAAVLSAEAKAPAAVATAPIADVAATVKEGATTAKAGATPASMIKPSVALQEARENRKALIWANAINLGTSFLNAGAEHYGARQCLNEGDARVAALHGRFQRTLTISVPIDAAIGLASLKLRHKHPGLAMWLPATSAGVQTGFAVIQYTQGCF